MPHRPYGIPSPKPRPTSSGPTRVEWSGGAIIGGIILIVIVLGLIMYEVTKIGTSRSEPGYDGASHDGPSRNTGIQRAWAVAAGSGALDSFPVNFAPGSIPALEAVSKSKGIAARLAGRA